MEFVQEKFATNIFLFLCRLQIGFPVGRNTIIIINSQTMTVRTNDTIYGHLFFLFISCTCITFSFVLFLRFIRARLCWAAALLSRTTNNSIKIEDDATCNDLHVERSWLQWTQLLFVWKADVCGWVKMKAIGKKRSSFFNCPQINLPLNLYRACWKILDRGLQ